MNKKHKTIIKILLLILFSLLLSVSCKKDLTLPDVKYSQNYLVISPNQDGIQDKLIIKAELSTKNYISYWEMQILNENKEIIYINKCDEDLEKMKKKLFIKKRDIYVPSEISWDAKNLNKKIVPDGKYFIKYIVMDNKKNIIDTESIGLGTVYVDTKKPALEYNMDNKIFSPNNDGNKDELLITLKITPDQLESKNKELQGNDWVIDILNNIEEVVKTIPYNDKDGYMKNLKWDGKDNSNKLVKDGYYKVRFYGKDKGGNFYEESVAGITVDTLDDPVEVTVLDNAFSPNNDNKKDSINFKLKVEDKDSIDSWEFSIFNKAGKAVKTSKGKKNIQDTLKWNGLNEMEKISEEDAYYGKLTVKYVNGNISTADSDFFILDITAPDAKVSTNIDVFSPDGNNVKDGVQIKQQTSEEKTEWNAVITDENNKIVINYSWKRNVPSEIIWSGNDAGLNKLNDGIYFYQLSCTDFAGNYFETEKKKMEIYTKKSLILVLPLLKTISPDNNGIADVQKLKISIKKEEQNPILDWEILIMDSSENIVYNEKKTGELPEEYIWNGKDNDGKMQKDGVYTVIIITNSFFGITSKSKEQKFNIDLTPPDIIVENDKIFSPDDNGLNDTLTLKFTKAFDQSGIKNWKLIIINPYTEKEFISFNGTGTPKDDIIWNGYGANGNLVESVEEYPLMIEAEDLVGNVLKKSFNPILIDILVIKLPDGRYKIRISNIQFKPNRASMTDDKKNYEILNMLGNALKKFPTHIITIEGYANRFAKNLNEDQANKLSYQRAVTVSGELQKRGIDKKRINTVGKGFDNPIIPLKDDMTEDERKEMAVNRRVEFYLSK